MLQQLTEPLKIRQTTLGEGFPKICVPLTERTLPALREEVRAAVEAAPDLIEWRADFYQELLSPQRVTDCLKVLRDTAGQIPIIFTVRTRPEGGNVDLLTKDYVNVLKSVSQTGLADLVDVEYFREPSAMGALIDLIHKCKVRVIASNHDFHGTPPKAELIRRMKAMDQAGADVLKVAAMPENFDQVCDLLKATREMVQEYTSRPVVSVSMSEQGKICRYSGEIFGSCMTFAAVGRVSAPGQESIADMRRALEFYHENFV